MRQELTSKKNAYILVDSSGNLTIVSYSINRYSYEVKRTHIFDKVVIAKIMRSIYKNNNWKIEKSALYVVRYALDKKL